VATACYVSIQLLSLCFAQDNREIEGGVKEAAATLGNREDDEKSEYFEVDCALDVDLARYFLQFIFEADRTVEEHHPVAA